MTTALAGHRAPAGAMAGAACAGALALGVLTLGLVPGPAGPAGAPAAHTNAEVSRQFARLPLRFEANRGQADGAVDFLARGPGYTMSLGRDGAVLALATGKGRGGASGSRTVVGMHLVGGNPRPVVSGADRLPGASNYLIGDNPRNWHQNVPSFAEVRYQGVYPGVDMVYHGNQRQLEYDLVVAPGTSPARIALGFRGAQRLSITRGGELLIHARGGKVVRQRAPVIYQGDGAARHRVSGHYVLRGSGHRVGFRVGAYDRSRPLVIDPTIAYSTYLGGYNTVVANGSSQDTANGIAVDAAGSAYVVGFTDSIPPSPYPTTTGAVQTAFGGGARDAFVTKLNPAGTAAVYSTYLGGNGDDRASDVAVDSSGNAYVTGQTTPPTAAPVPFPTTPGAAQTTPGGGTDAFLAKLNAAGSALTYSSFLGGSGSDAAVRIDIGPLNAATISGTTSPPNGTATTPSVTDNFPTTAGSFQPTFGGGAASATSPFASPSDAFAARINPAGSAFDYSTFLGGTQPDSAGGVAVDAAGAAYVTGATRSPGVFGTPGAFQTTIASTLSDDSDAFVAKLNVAGSALAYATYVGGARFDTGKGVAVDGSGSAYITGETNSTNYPVKNANQPANASAPGPNDSDSFLTKLNPSGSDTVYSTYNGSNTYDTGTDIAVDPSGNAYAVGNTLGGFPLKNPVQVRTGDYDAYLTKFNATGGVTYSTMYGGGARDFGQAVATDSAGNAYVGGRTDYFSDDSFPVKSAFQPRNAGFADAWIAKITQTPNSPLVNSLRSRGGPVSGGTSVILTGVGLTGATAVKFGDTAAASFVVDSDTQITAVGPAHAAGKVNVTVTTPAGTSPDNPVTLFEYAEGVWRLTGSLGAVHYDQQLKLLDDGRILIIGGQNSMFGNAIATTEVFNPKTGQWNATGSLATARSAYTATRLDGPACRAATRPAYCGDILVAGGSPNSAGGTVAAPTSALNSAEIYDAATGAWRGTGNLNVARGQHAATLLDGPECHAGSPPSYCGKVLVSGGYLFTPTTVLNSAELYDPATGQWTVTGPFQHTARLTSSVLLPSGKVLLPGGTGSDRAATEIYDPASGSWNTTGPLNIGRERETLIVLRDGKVLAAAGTTPGDPAYLGTQPRAGDTAEIYDEATGVWTQLPDRSIGVARNNHDSALLPNGKVLVADGGRGGLTAELFDPTDRKWRSAGLLNISRGSGHPQTGSYDTVVLSSDQSRFAADSAVCGNNCGKVLVAGNNDDRTTELYTPEPRVDALDPTTGAAAGGTSVKITGQGFTHGVRSVLFGTTPATSFTADSYGQITAVAPPGSGAKTVTVINEGGTATSSGSFTYAAAVPETTTPGTTPPPGTPGATTPGVTPPQIKPPAGTPVAKALVLRLARFGKPRVARGVGVRVSCSTACAFTVRLTISAATARKYGLGRKTLTIGTVRGSLKAAGAKKLTVKLSARTRRRLRRARTVSATLRGSARRTGGKPVSKSLRVKLRR